MRWIVSSSVRLAVVVLVVVGLVLGIGVVVLTRAPVDTLPEMLPTQVEVQSDAIGLSSQEVEQFLAVPSEYELATVAFLDSLKSRSVPGLASILLTFKPNINVWVARQLVAERMAQVPMPVDIGIPPVMIQPLSSSSRAMMIGLTSKSVAPIDLTTLAKWRIRPRLLAVPGVANVTMWGQKDREMLVLLDPARMAQHGVTLDQVLTTVGDSMWTSPLTFVPASTPGADGLIDTRNQRLTIQHILPIITSKDLVSVPIEGTGPKPVSVGDVSTIVEDHSQLPGDALVNNGPGLILVVEKLPGADSLAVDRGVAAAMNELQPGLSGITVDTSLYRPGNFLNDSMRSIGIAGAIAFFVACVWLGVAYRSWRVALSAAVAIAASLLAACLVLYATGRTFNALVFTGLVMALGVIVDDTVVGALAMRRRLELADVSGEHVPGSTVVTEAFLLQRGPVGFTFAALVVAAVPLFFVPGVAGTLSAQMVIAYLIAILASAVVSATVAPALAVLLLPSRPHGAHGTSWLGRAAQAIVGQVARWPGVVATFALLVVAASIVGAVVSLPHAFVPSLRDGSLVIRWQAFSGTGLNELKRITSSAEVPLRALPGVDNVTTHVGRALASDQIVGSDSAETWISLKPNVDYAKTVLKVREILNGFPGLGHTVESYTDSAIARAKAGTGGSSADLTVRVYGSDFGTLASSAAKVQEAIKAVPGVAETQVTTSTSQPLIQVETDIKKAAAYGLKPGDIRRQAAAILGSILVGSYYQDQQVFDVAVWGSPSLRQNPGDIANLPIFAADGRMIPLKTVATVSFKPTPAIIDHDKTSRFLDVNARVSGASAGSVVSAVQQKMRALPLPLGYHTEVSSGLQQRQQAYINLELITLAGALAIFLLLQAALQSWRRAFIVLIFLPFAMSGSLLSAAAFGWGLTLGVVAGVVTVLGVAIRNATTIVGRFAAAGDSPHARDEIRAVATVSGEAAVPVVGTAVALAILVSPFVVLGNTTGIEILKPFAVVVIFGLVTSTLLTLVVLPAIYRRWGMAHTHRADTEGAQS